MAIDKFVTAEAAVALIADGDTVALIGGGGGLCEATCLHEAIEKRFLETGHPRGLTVIHSLGIGDRKSRGMNRFAHEGMVKRVIGGHWVWSPRMQQLAKDEKIEAYVFPGGVAMQLFREIGAGRPGLFTHVGLGTFVDPRVEGGRMNKAAKDDLIEVVTIDGKELLRYQARFPVNVAVIRGSFADAHGNISLDQEPANVDIYAAALAAHNSGGKVIVQVRTAVEVGALPARSVRVPGAIVDAVVVDPMQSMGYDVVYDPTMSGEIKGPPRPADAAAVHGAPADRAPRGRGTARRRGAQLRLRHSGRRRQARSPNAGISTATIRPSSTAPMAASCSKARCSAMRATRPR